MSDENWIAKTIVPKSDQINADDLITGPIVVTVIDVRQGEFEQPVVLVIDGDRQPYKPCKTMRRLLVSLWGERASDWIGKQLELYADPNVKWGGVAVGGIRISAVSGIDQPHTVMLTVTRGKREAVTIKPLQTSAPKLTIADRVAKAVAAYEGCGTADELMVIAKKCEPLAAECDDAHKAKLSAAYEVAMARVNEAKL